MARLDSFYKQICAVILTYNPSGSIEPQVKSLLRFLKTIVIVDNNSSRGALTQLKALKNKYGNGIQLITNENNIGVAAGYNAGLAYAAKNKFTFGLLFDHDSLIDESFFPTLKESYSRISGPDKLAVLGAFYRDEGYPQIHPETPQDRYSVLSVATVISSGSLIVLNIWQQIGRFKENLFIDYVDDEYCLRARKSGYDVAIISKAIFSHRIGNTVQRKFLWFPVYPMQQSPFRWYHVARNFLFLVCIYAWREKKWAIKGAIALIKRFTAMLLFEDQRWKKVKSILKGCRDAFSLG